LRIVQGNAEPDCPCKHVVTIGKSCIENARVHPPHVDLGRRTHCGTWPTVDHHQTKVWSSLQEVGR
jgi:hypothetical protein